MAVTHGNRISEEAILATLPPRQGGDFTGERAVSVGGQVLPRMSSRMGPKCLATRELHTRHGDSVYDFRRSEARVGEVRVK